MSSLFSCNRILIHSAVYLTLLPKRILHRGRSYASNFNFKYSPLSLSSSSSWLRLLPPLPVSSISPSIFPPITCFWRKDVTNHFSLPSFLLHVWCFLPGLLAVTANGSSKQAWHIPDVVCTVLEFLMMGGETARNMYSIDNNEEYCITLHLVGCT